MSNLSSATSPEPDDDDDDDGNLHNNLSDNDASATVTATADTTIYDSDAEYLKRQIQLDNNNKRFNDEYSNNDENSLTTTTTPRYRNVYNETTIPINNQQTVIETHSDYQRQYGNYIDGLSGSSSQRNNNNSNINQITTTRSNSNSGYGEGIVETPVNGNNSDDSNIIGVRSPMASFNEERMRKRLQFFFMNPIEKWQVKRRFPYKFVVQLIKLVMVTTQLCLFAHSRYNHVNYTWDNRITFSHLFLRGWDATLEVESYPPATGPLALYIQEEFFETIDYAIAGYSNLSIAIGPYSYPSETNEMSPLHLCLYSYKEGTIFGFNESYIFNSEIVKTCIDLMGNVTEIGTKEYLESHDIPINFSALIKSKLDFSIKTINFKAAGPIAPPDCYQFDITIYFDNHDHDGQMLLSLDAEPIRLHCNGNKEYKTDSEIDAALRSILNALVILICILSFALCARAIYRAQLLRIKTVNFFRITYNTELSLEGKMEFVNFWYIMIICNDILLIMGSAMKEQIERSNFTGNEWNTCSVLLGIGNLLVWFGVLRYLGFFKTYNVVILTLKRAAPKISRFLLCALLIYAGFTFCGWLILGPYHIKFRSLATTSECLFSLINGDDMFATFSIMSSKSQMLWWFSRIYLYSFISLYIYVVLSLFISVIMDAYDTIKKYYKDGFPHSDLKQFIVQMNAAAAAAAAATAAAAGSSSGQNLQYNDMGDEDDDETNEINPLRTMFKKVCCCCQKRKVDIGPTGYTSLNPKI